MKFIFGMLFVIVLHGSGILTVDSFLLWLKPILNEIFLDLVNVTR